MNDFYSFDEYSIPFWIKALYWGLYMLVFVYAIRKLFFSATKDEKQRDVTRWFGVFFALYAVFYCINTDYFRYREWLHFTDIDYWNKEKFYLYTALFCRSLPFEYPYEVFRLIVWGGGILLFYQICRVYKELLPPGLTLLLLFVFHAGGVSYARASLAMAVYFFGIALFVNNKRLFWKIVGIAVAISSFFFHREMIVAIGLLPCLFIPFEKKSMSFLSIFVLIMAVAAIPFLFSNIEYLDAIFDNDDISSKIEEMNEKEEKVFRLSTLIRYLKFFVPFFLIMRILWKRKALHSVIVMYRITFSLLMVSVAFMIVFGLRSVYAYRIMNISMIPMTLLISYCYSRNYFTRVQLFILMFIVLISSSAGIVNAI